MQWYKKTDPFYKRLFNRELQFIKEHNASSMIQFETLFLKDTNEFCTRFVLDSKLVVLFYPENYPNVKIEMGILDPEYSLEDFKLSNKLIGHHQSDGWICYNHNQWSTNWGIEFLYNRAKEWLTDGKFDNKNDGLIPNSDLIFIMPNIKNLSVLTKWGFFEYFEVNPDTYFIKALKSTKYNNGLENIIVDEENSINFTIPECFRKNKLKLKKGLYLINKETLLNSVDKSVLMTTCLRSSLPLGSRGIDKLISNNLLSLPIPILNIKPSQGISHILFYDEKYNVTVPKLNLLKDKENIIMDKTMLETIKNKKVALVGIGSIGSTIACQLAKSGIENITLIDRDKLEVSNLYRHELDLNDIGKNKAVAMKEKLRKINPDLFCNSKPVDATTIIDELLEQDLIISSVDNEETRLILDEKLIPKNKTILYVNSFYDSIAGIIFISNKRKSSCYKCFSDWLDYEIIKNKTLPNFQKLIPKESTLNCGSSSIPGTSQNTSQIALYGSKIAIQYLSSGYEQDNDGNRYNVYLYANDMVEQDSNKYFENAPLAMKFISDSYEGCHICSRKKDIFTDEEQLQYSSTLKEVLCK